MQTIQTGQSHTVRHFDGLLRPRVMRSFDSSDPGGTGSVVELRYDNGGRKSFQSYPARGAAAPTGQRWSYDALGRETRMEQDSELGVLSTQTEYLANFSRRTTNPRGFATTYDFQAYDTPSEDHLVQALLPLNISLVIDRDPLGKARSITRAGSWGGEYRSATRSYAYDVHERLCKTVEPEIGATVQAYDSAGNLGWRASGLSLPGPGCDSGAVPGNRKASFAYDDMDRPLSTTFGDGSPGITRSYWPDGREKSNSSGTWTWAMEYNNRRLLTKETYSFRSYGSYPIRRLYDAYGHQRQINYWGEKTVAYAPNALGQPTQASGFASQVRWHPNGMLASFTRPGQAGSHSTTLNARQLPEQWVDTGVLHDRISYDRNGNVSQIEDLHSGLNTRSMGYDALDRLTAANGGGWGSGSYDYDALDNLRTSQLGGRSLVHSVDPVNQRLTAITGSLSLSFGYDVQGNITSRSTPSTGQGFVFDIANRMTRAVAVPGVGDLQYTYDGNGRRAWVDYPDGRYRGFAYAQDGQLLITGDSVYEGDAWHVYLGGRKVGQYSLGRGVEHIHTDQLGSAVATSSNAGLQAWTRKRYEPYGAPRPGSEVPVSSGYTGHAHDPETALVQMQQRYYEPLAGRFLSVDPVTTNARTGAMFNRYEYANNNPYRYFDPDGRCSASRIDVAPGSICGGSGSALQAATASIAAAQQHVAREVASAARGAGNALAAGAQQAAGMLRYTPLGMAAGRLFSEGANTEGVGQRTVDDLIGESTAGSETKGRADQYIHGGGRGQRDKDFDSLGATDVKDRGNGTRTGTLPDGRPVNVHDSKTDGVPTIQIGNGSREIKIRYP